jgi:lipopolysaccharide cholinephosphotransferase
MKRTERKTKRKRRTNIKKKKTSKKFSYENCTIDDFIVLKKEEVKLLYEITKKTINILNKAGIEYWAEGGTLIGAMRTDKKNPIGGFIPWDDDVDISIDKNDKPKLMKLKPILQKAGLILKSVGRYVKILKPGNNRVWIDIFYLHVNNLKDTTREFDAEYPQKQYHKYNYKKNDLFPLSEVPFGSKKIKMKVAKNARNYLHDCYPNWDKIAHLYNHHTKGKKKISFNKCPNLKVPLLLKHLR